jgi:hypothetical protein
MKKFSVRRLLNRHGKSVGRGAITKMHEKTDIHMNTAAKYFNGIDLQAVHLDVLTQICDYLQQEIGIDVPLPGSLFYEDTLWDALRDLDVTFFIGANWFEGESLDHDGRISRYDHRAQSLLAAHLAGLNPAKTDFQEEFVPYLHHYKPDDIPPSPEDSARSRKLYELYFAGDRKLKANIIIGSQKSNLVTELFVADCFGEQPFVLPGEPKVPFFLVPRESDSRFTSCFGGAEPPGMIERGHAPGIHYRENGAWSHSIEWFTDTQDAGVVLIRHKPATDVLDVAIFGFSALGTYLVAKHFVERGDLFWNSQHKPADQQIGLYLCEIALADHSVRKITPIDCHADNRRV